MLKRFAFTIILAIILVTSILLVGCTPSPTATSSPVPTATATAVPKPTPSSSPTATGPIRGGVLRIGMYSDAVAFNPNASTSATALDYTFPVFSGLVRTNPMKGQVSTENIIPDLAEKWDISPDGKTYTFHLRQGVKFHDGKPLTATDVKYSLDMYRNPKISPSANNVAAIDSVDIVDNNTVKVTLKYAFPDLLIMIVPPYFCILPEHLKNVDTKSTDFLVGTGPFKFKSRAVGKVYTYERNPDYYLKGQPYLDGVEVYVLTTTNMATQFVGGRLDSSGNTRQFLENWDDMQKVKQGAPEAPIITAEDGTLRAIQFNLARKGAWQDARVRQAMAMTIDYPGLTVACAGSLDVGHVAPVGLMPSYMKGAISQKDLVATLGIDKPMDQRIAKAKQLMQDAGYASGFSAEVIANDTPTTRDAAIFLADLWKRSLNINLKVTVLQPVNLYPRASSGDFDMYEIAYTGTGDSPIEYLGQFITGSPVNNGKWSNTDYDQLFQQIMRETDPAKSVDEIQKAQQIFLKDLPLVVLHSVAYSAAIRPDLKVGWPALRGPVPQPGSTTLSEVDSLWFAGTQDAARWMKSQ
jgi:peptide/nickel transport system substrate-binding protein